jgi:hypothetical protein
MQVGFGRTTGFEHPLERTGHAPLAQLQVVEGNGRGDWIRTSDPLRPRQVRYQAALRPDFCDYSRAPRCSVPLRPETTACLPGFIR